MPSNELAIFQEALPAHIAALNDELSNITARASTNSIVLDGGRWSVNLDGVKTKITRKNADGEDEPVAILPVVVLDYVKNRGREFYAKAYNPQAPTIPDCWSEDSVAPHANVPADKRQCATCAACPKSKKGSAQNAAGVATTACGQFQKLAVVPIAGLMEGRFPPIRLRLKITSIYDKDGEGKHPGWFAWNQYTEMLFSKGVKSTGLFPTKMKADPDVSYSKILFSPGKTYLTEQQLEVVKDLMLSDTVKALLAETYNPTAETTGTKAVPEDEEEEELQASPEVPAQAKPVTKADRQKVSAANVAAQKAKPAPVEDEDEEEVVAQPVAEDDEEEEVVAAPVKPKPVATTAAKANASAATAAVAKATQKAAARAPVADDEEEEAPTAVAPPVKPKPAAVAAKPAATKGAPAAKALDAPADVAALLGSWDD